ncbi:MAG: sulfurase [Ilumatobacteraceae bacterium]|nr:sulfurase [Ilumatobacteraceae bacterium]
MHVSAIWRYPVKSLGGEPLVTADLTSDGISGDRIVHVHDSNGVITGRTRHGLLTLPVTTGADGVPLVDGSPWTSAAAAESIRRHAGDGAALASYDGPERFDIGNLLVATDGAVAAFGHDVRRIRPNILLAGVSAAAEATWPGRALSIGDAIIGVHSLRRRCVVTSIDPDTGDRSPDVFRRIIRDFGGELALNCWVIRPGTIRVGDVAGLVDSDALPAHLGGWILGAPYTVGR